MKQIIYVFLLTVLSSCDSYLSKVPSPSTSAPINNVEQLVAIYDNATAFINETNPFACYSNDDADLTAELYKADPSAFAISSTYNPQIQISAESETKRSIFREKDKTKRSKKESAQHSKSRNKSFVMTSVSAL